MTVRADQLARQKARVQAQLEATRRRVAQLDAALREDDRKELRKRHARVGALAEQAGLFAWSDADLAAVFAALARLGGCPHPGAVLEGLLTHSNGSLPVHGSMDPRQPVAGGVVE